MTACQNEPKASHDPTSVKALRELLNRAAAGDASLLLDGALGTMLQATGLLGAGEAPFNLNVSAPEAVIAVHRDYAQAGSQALITNSFGATRYKLKSADAVITVNAAAVQCARAASPAWVAGDIGPIGTLLEPYGDLEEAQAFDLFAEQASALDAAGCDLFAIETMTDLVEATTAVRAVRSVSQKPVFVTLSFGESGRSFMGVTPEQAIGALADLDVQAIGANCSVGPDSMRSIIAAMSAALKAFGVYVPIIAQPNAGAPQQGSDGKTIYAMTADAFATSMRAVIDAGASIVGGCCGTTPAFIAALKDQLKERKR